MLVGAVCLGKWIGHEMNSTCIESIKSGLNKSKSHIQAYLIGLTIGLRFDTELSGGLLVLLSSLTNIVKEVGQTHIYIYIYIYINLYICICIYIY
jgi:hypothetical protein